MYDLSSTHGTIINKMKVPQRKFVRLKVGSVIKFGESTRLFIVQGPQEHEQEVKEYVPIEQIKEFSNQPEEEEDNGINWFLPFF